NTGLNDTNDAKHQKMKKKTPNRMTPTMQGTNQQKKHQLDNTDNARKGTNRLQEKTLADKRRR
ncbi:18913_t:CDS:1, partial [Dentiscutata erythropus]